MIFSKSVRFVERPDKFIVYFRDTGDFFETNSTGGYIIKSLNSGKTREQIIDELAENTGEPKDVVGRDLQDFIDVLKKKGIIEKE